jgi:hypothetical protein
MGVSTNGQICFGILFEEGFEFPWDTEDEDPEGDLEEWWLYKICGYRNPIELYNKEGGYLNGVEPSKKDADLYYSSRRDYLQKHPVPVKLVNYCSGECPMYILAIRRTSIYNNRGYPKEFDPKELTVTKEESIELRVFCKKYINFSAVYYPKWYLSSYWG